MSSALRFPAAELLRAIEANGKLEEVLTQFSEALARDPAGKWVPDFCKDWLRCSDAKVNGHKRLRAAIYLAIFEHRVLVNAPVEVYWDIACRFGPKNQTVVVKYLDAAPKSVPIKLGRLLSAKAEFGVAPMPMTVFQQVIAVLFASPIVAQGVMTREWQREISSMRSEEAKILTQMATAYAPEGPVRSLVTLFPQLSANQAHLLLVKTGESVEQLTQKMLDIPDFVSQTLEETNSKASRPKKYVVLDEEEKQRRANALRQKQRLEFSYKYTTFEDEDPDPEAEETVQQEFSEADKRLMAQEQLLWSYWHKHRDVFDRQSRKSGVRKELKAKLNWTDEQIEGWGRVSAKSAAATGKEQLNMPKHFKEVEAYVPALRESTRADIASSHANAQVAPPEQQETQEAKHAHVNSRQKPKQGNESGRRAPGSKQGGKKDASGKPAGSKAKTHQATGNNTTSNKTGGHKTAGKTGSDKGSNKTSGGTKN